MRYSMIQFGTTQLSGVLLTVQLSVEQFVEHGAVWFSLGSIVLSSSHYCTPYYCYLLGCAVVN